MDSIMVNEEHERYYRKGFIDGIEEEKKRSIRYSEIEKVMDGLVDNCSPTQFHKSYLGALIDIKEAIRKELNHDM